MRQTQRPGLGGSQQWPAVGSHFDRHCAAKRELQQLPRQNMTGNELRASLPAIDACKPRLLAAGKHRLLLLGPEWIEGRRTRCKHQARNCNTSATATIRR